MPYDLQSFGAALSAPKPNGDTEWFPSRESRAGILRDGQLEGFLVEKALATLAFFFRRPRFLSSLPGMRAATRDPRPAERQQKGTRATATPAPRAGGACKQRPWVGPPYSSRCSSRGSRGARARRSGRRTPPGDRPRRLRRAARPRQQMRYARALRKPSTYSTGC